MSLAFISVLVSDGLIFSFFITKLLVCFNEEDNILENLNLKWKKNPTYDIKLNA